MSTEPLTPLTWFHPATVDFLANQRPPQVLANVNGFAISANPQGNVESNTWPFHVDAYHMGTVPAKDFAVMFAHFGNENEQNDTGRSDRNEYVILHHIPTGKRIRIELPRVE